MTIFNKKIIDFFKVKSYEKEKEKKKIKMKRKKKMPKIKLKQKKNFLIYQALHLWIE